MKIGLFDSGVGGLTVLKELRATFPKVDFTYLGDTARLPYGNKAQETLKKYTAENIEFLDSQDVDLIVIACHSASSVSLDLASSPKGTPIFNMITPSAILAQELTTNGVLGVMATKATIRSQIYPKHFSDLSKSLKVISQECPLLVPLVEEGLIEDEITDFVLTGYLKTIKESGADTVILGCTHYPILRGPIARHLGKKITLVDPARAVAKQIKENHPTDDGSGSLEIYLTDHAPHFLEHATALLGDKASAPFLTPES